MENFIEVTTADGKRFSVVAMDADGEGFAPGVAEVDANGEIVRTIVDAEATDELYSTARECLIRAMVHVI